MIDEKKPLQLPDGYIAKEHFAHSYRSEFGRSSIVIECPFCKNEVTAYVWSLAGSGKKCPYCKDVIHYMAISINRAKE